MVKECPSELSRVLADTRNFLSQPASRGERRSDRPGTKCVVDPLAGYRQGDLPEWHPFAVWHRHVLTER